MKNTISFLCMTLGSSLIFAQQAKTSEIALSYTFSKVNLDGLNSDQLMRYTQNDVTRYKSTLFSWGNQGTATYKKKLKNSNYNFLADFTVLHTRKNQAVGLGIGQGSVNDWPADTIPARSSYFAQLNMYQIDMFVDVPLKTTKHAVFSVQGGGLSGYYTAYDKIKDTGNIDLLSTTQKKASNRYSNSYTGPNLKILVDCPFYKDQLFASLKAGVGMMMSFQSETHKTKESTYGLYGVLTETTASKTSKENEFHFSPQADIDASIGFKKDNFSISTGLNLFYMAYELNQENVIFAFRYGGPYIKASYQF
jgi:hypothetical protein